MNKKILLAAGSVVAALSLAAGSLSYFSAQQSVTNVVTVGNIKCSLTEPCYSKLTDGTLKISAMPGTKINKDPTVKNTGSNDAWLYVQAEIQWDCDPAALPQGAKLPTFRQLGISAGSNFTARGLDTTKAVFSYNGVFTKGAETKVFKATRWGRTEYTMQIPGGWDNAYQDAKIKIVITANAIQKDNVASLNDVATALDLDAALMTQPDAMTAMLAEAAAEEQSVQAGAPSAEETVS